jgi:hypothetical protein
MAMAEVWEEEREGGEVEEGGGVEATKTALSSARLSDKTWGRSAWGSSRPGSRAVAADLREAWRHFEF